VYYNYLTPEPTARPTQYPTVQEFDYYGASFATCPAYSGTGVAEKTYYTDAGCGVYVCPNEVLTISGCPAITPDATCSGDPLFFLHDASSTTIDSTWLLEDDEESCSTSSLCPFASYTYTGSACTTWVIQGGCYGEGTTCSATYVVSITNAARTEESRVVKSQGIGEDSVVRIGQAKVSVEKAQASENSLAVSSSAKGRVS